MYGVCVPSGDLDNATFANSELVVCYCEVDFSGVHEKGQGHFPRILLELVATRGYLEDTSAEEI